MLGPDMWVSYFGDGSGKVLCKIVSFIFVPGFPENVEMFLDNSVADPMVAHVDGAGTLAPDGVIGNAVGGGIVGSNGRGGLYVSHFGRCSANNFALCAIYKQTADFRFGGRGGDMLEDAGGVEHSAVVDFRFVWLVAEEKMSTRSAACVGFV